MARTITYVLMAKTLSGDSIIRFFKNENNAEKYFISLIEEPLELCKDAKNELEEDIDWCTYQSSDGDVFGYRFNVGGCKDLNAILGDCDVYVECITLTISNDTTHYVADLNTHVDESIISFYDERTGEHTFEKSVDECLIIVNKACGCELVRHVDTSYEDDDCSYTFHEQYNEDENAMDVYFDLDGVDFTYRYGAIEFAD